MTEAHKLFDSYNLAVSEGYNNAIAGKSPKEAIRITQDEVLTYVEKSISDWMYRPIESGIIPIKYIENINSLEEAIDLFKIGSRICDDDIPEILASRLKDFGDSIINEMLKLAIEDSYLSDEEDIYVSLNALKLLGRWKAVNCVKDLIELMYKYGPEKEILHETVIDTLISIGRGSLTQLIKTLNSVDEIKFVEEYLLAALVKIGSGCRNDEIYRCAKAAFLKMEDKVLGAMCIADYGDGRAIPVLKGYIEKNKNTLDKETYLEIKRAVKKLGGDISSI